VNGQGSSKGGKGYPGPTRGEIHVKDFSTRHYNSRECSALHNLFTAPDYELSCPEIQWSREQQHDIRDYIINHFSRAGASSAAPFTHSQTT